MAWVKEKTKRISLDPVGYEDLWVEIRSMGSLSYKQTKDLQKRVNQLLKVVGENSETASEEDEAEGITSIKVLFSELVKDWNLPAAGGEIGDGSKMALPKTDPSVIEDIPLEILGFIGERIQDDGAVGVPNENGT